MIVQVEPGSHLIASLAKARLQASPYQSIQKILCEYDDGLLLLQGRLPSYYHKQVAQVAVANIAGVRQVLNHIEVS